MVICSFFSGATHSKLVIIGIDGIVRGEWSHNGLNYCLDGCIEVADKIAAWIRSAKREIGINAPLGAVVSLFKLFGTFTTPSLSYVV